MLALTQLRALHLIFVPVHVPVNGGEEEDGEGEEEENEEEEEGEFMPELTSTLVNLTHLTLYNVVNLGDPEALLACVRSLTKLVDLDISDTCIQSGDVINLTRGPPITGLKIWLENAGHVSKVAGWLESCIPCTLRCLGLTIPWYEGEPACELQPSQVARLLSPLRSAGAQLQALTMFFFDLSDVDSVSILTGLTQLTKLDLQACKFNDDGWALLEPAFAHINIQVKRRDDPDDGDMSSFHVTAAPWG